MSNHENTRWRISYEREDLTFGGTIWHDVPGSFPTEKAESLAVAMAMKPENIRVRMQAIGRKDRFFPEGQS